MWRLIILILTTAGVTSCKTDQGSEAQEIGFEGGITFSGFSPLGNSPVSGFHFSPEYARLLMDLGGDPAKNCLNPSMKRVPSAESINLAIHSEKCPKFIWSSLRDETERMNVWVFHPQGVPLSEPGTRSNNLRSDVYPIFSHRTANGHEGDDQVQLGEVRVGTDRAGNLKFFYVVSDFCTGKWANACELKVSKEGHLLSMRLCKNEQGCGGVISENGVRRTQVGPATGADYEMPIVESIWYSHSMAESLGFFGLNSDQSCISLNEVDGNKMVNFYNQRCPRWTWQSLDSKKLAFSSELRSVAQTPRDFRLYYKDQAIGNVTLDALTHHKRGIVYYVITDLCTGPYDPVCLIKLDRNPDNSLVMLPPEFKY